MGARNIRKSLYPLYSKLKTLIWVMHYLIVHQQTAIAFSTDCSELMKIVSTSVEWLAFSIHLEKLAKSKEFFYFFSISLIPRTSNTKVDKLACSVQLLPHNAIYVNIVPPI